MFHFRIYSNKMPESTKIDLDNFQGFMSKAEQQMVFAFLQRILLSDTYAYIWK